MSKRFIIYADGGSKVCLGHIMRTLTLAEAMRSEDIDVIFATSSKDAQFMVEDKGFFCILINELDYTVLAQKALEYDVSGIMVDKFGFQLQEHQLLHDKIGLLVQIDDFTYSGPADIIINATLDTPPSINGASWLCGGKYAIIRECFVNREKIIADEPKDVLITTGYGDPTNSHLKCIKAVMKILPQSNIHVVYGNGYKTEKELEDMKNHHLYLYKNLNNISTLMHQCDMALTSAGTTLYEMAAAGLPAIAFSLYDNQIDNLERVKQKGCIYSLGWHEELSVEKIEKAIEEVAFNKSLRMKMNRAGNEWIDGKGVNRIAKYIKARL